MEFSWFQQVDQFFDLLCFVITLLLVSRAFGAARFFEDQKYRMLGQGFLLLSIGYLFLGIADWLVDYQARSNLPLVMKILMIQRTVESAFLIYAMLLLGGTLLLLFVYMRIESLRQRLLLFCLVLFSFFVSQNRLATYYLLLSILLVFIIIQQFITWYRKPRRSTFLVLIGFVLIFLGEVALSMVWLGEFMHDAGTITTLLGFLSLLFSQVRK